MVETQTLALLIPAYNAARHLPRLLASAAAQSEPFDEILVYDDASTDDTAAVAARLGARVIGGEVNRGCSCAKNAVARASDCVWLHFHDADDDLKPEFVALTRPWRARRRHDVVLFDYEEIDDVTGARLGVRRFDAAAVAEDARRYAIREQINPFCGLYRREAFLAAGGYDEDPLVLFNEDVAFHIRLAFVGLSFAVEPEVAIVNRRRVDSMSAANGRRCVQAQFHVMRKTAERPDAAPYRADIAGRLEHRRRRCGPPRLAHGGRRRRTRLAARRRGRRRALAPVPRPRRRRAPPGAARPRGMAARPAPAIAGAAMTSPRVSVVIPCWNAARTLGATLESVLAQTWPNLEIIVVDDGSTDDSADEARRFAARGVALARLGHNRGQTAALNVGVRAARGEFIQYLDADDLLSPNKIEAQMLRLQGARDCVATAEWARFRCDPAEARFRPERVWRDLAPLDWLAGSRAGGLGMMFPALWLIPSAIVAAVGPWREDLTLNNDAEYFTRVVLASRVVLFCAGARCYYRSGGAGNLSGRRTRAAFRSQEAVLDACETLVLAREDSPRMRAGFAQSWQHFAHACHPYAPDLAERARGARRACTRSASAPTAARLSMSPPGCSAGGSRARRKRGRAAHPRDAGAPGGEAAHASRGRAPRRRRRVRQLPRLPRARRRRRAVLHARILGAAARRRLRSDAPALRGRCARLDAPAPALRRLALLPPVRAAPARAHRRGVPKPAAPSGCSSIRPRSRRSPPRSRRSRLVAGSSCSRTDWRAPISCTIFGCAIACR